LQVSIIEIYWAKKAAQYKTLEGTYTQKELNASVSITVDTFAISIICNERLSDRSETEKKSLKKRYRKRFKHIFFNDISTA
jgi:hypothetical protein